MEFSKEFKAAVTALSTKEKDKLIFRLLRKDKILAHRLYFELIAEETQDQKREKIENLLLKEIPDLVDRYKNTKYFVTELRRLSAKITEHVKITSDKFGEVSLNLILINETLNRISDIRDIYKTCYYLLNKIFRVLVLTKKLDSDYYLDLRQQFSLIRQYFEDSPLLKQLAAKNKLNLNWLNPEEIPEEIPQILKELKLGGLLK